MRTKKIRGHKRIWKDIEKWKNVNLKLDLEHLKQYERNYTKIWVYPFNTISLVNSQIPEPKGETKNKILNGLLDIYEGWRNQLNELNEPYYLKIWLFEPRFSKSQIVCSIGNSINLYKNTFSIPETIQNLKTDSIGVSVKRIKNYIWEQRVDEEILDNTEIGSLEDFKTEKDYLENKNWFESKLKESHRKTVYKKPIGDITESYAFKLGDVWLGEKKGNMNVTHLHKTSKNY